MRHLPRRPTVKIRARQQGHTVILDLVGRLVGGEAAAELEQALRALAHAGTRTLIVNCDGLRSIDFAGLAALVDGRREVGAAGGELRLAGLSRHGGDLVIITRLATTFNVYDSVEAAVEGPIAAIASTSPTPPDPPTRPTVEPGAR
jgi:anti-anti-sigma factor